MLRSETVFILGAGSSFDFGFPLGADLKNEIAAVLEYSIDSLGKVQISKAGWKIVSAITRAPQLGLNREEVLKAADMIRGGVCLASSIDHFLWLHSENVAVSACAKAAIAHLIYEKEYSCEKLRHLASGERRTPTEFDKTWVQPFCEICFEGVSLCEVQDALSRVKVISFNYDRCVERVLAIAIEALYAVSAEKAAALANTVEVLHPYGCLGLLDKVPSFGRRTGLNPYDLSLGIKTFSERQDDEDLLKKIKQLVSSASTLVFLGFGFHKQNIDILVPATNEKHKRIIATAKNVAAEARQVLELKLKTEFALKNGNRKRAPSAAEAEVSFMDCNCATLLNEHRLGLVD